MGEFFRQRAAPAYFRTHIGQQFVEMPEMVGRDAESTIYARGWPLDPLEVQHHIHVLMHFGCGRLLHKLAVAIAHQPVGGHLRAQHGAETGIEADETHVGKIGIGDHPVQPVQAIRLHQLVAVFLWQKGNAKLEADREDGDIGGYLLPPVMTMVLPS